MLVVGRMVDLAQGRAVVSTGRPRSAAERMCAASRGPRREPP
jgi:hypothetical protein